ncbi:10622_t:CDS:1, partial [Racocetra persica]
IPTLPEDVRDHPGTEREKLWNAIQWVDRQNEITQDFVKREVRRKEIEYQKDINKQLNRTIEDFRKTQDYEKQAILHNLIQTSVTNTDPEIKTQAEIKYNEFMSKSLKNPKRTQKTSTKTTRIDTTKDFFKQLRKEDKQLKKITKERKQKEEEIKKTIDSDSDNESDLKDKNIQREHNKFIKNLNKSEGKQSNLRPDWQDLRSKSRTKY